MIPSVEFGNDQTWWRLENAKHTIDNFEMEQFQFYGGVMQVKKLADKSQINPQTAKRS